MILAIIGLLISLILIYKGGTQLQETKNLINNGQRTKGEVIENEKIFETELDDDEGITFTFSLELDRSNDVWYIPIIEYKDNNGRNYIVTDEYNKSRSKHRIGKKIDIIYDKDDPRSYIVRNSLAYIQSLIITILGIALFIISGYIILLES